MATRVLSMAKGSHRYVFRYTSGCEQRVVDEIMRLAEDPNSCLDWSDAATLGFQIALYASMSSCAGHASSEFGAHVER